MWQTDENGNLITYHADGVRTNLPEEEKYRIRKARKRERDIALTKSFLVGFFTPLILILLGLLYLIFIAVTQIWGIILTICLICGFHFMEKEQKQRKREGKYDTYY